ncbi:MAG TPA: Uma2 family endonuclease [Planctomycetaceae bacterium]|nr:Uma2 family endonuclease [Planctomycetaceae bacterium]
MSTATLFPALLTAEEYLRLPDSGRPTELVRGRVIPMNVPKPRHGQVCSRVDRFVGNFADGHDLGHVACNDSGVITERDPDTVRGADVCFYSYSKVPRGPFPEGYLPVPPDAVFEILSPDNRRPKVLTKVGEYLEANVTVVCVLDPESETVEVFREKGPSQTLSGDDELTLPDVLPGFSVPVRRFFE